MLAMSMPISAMKKVTIIARIGSFLALVALKTLRNGMMSSRAIACSSRGAPVQ